MILIILAFLGFFPNIALSCMNQIAESEIPKAIAHEPNVGTKICNNSDPCICFDGVDWDTAIYNLRTKTFSVDKQKYSDKQFKAATEVAIFARQKEYPKQTEISEALMDYAMNGDKTGVIAIYSKRDEVDKKYPMPVPSPSPSSSPQAVRSGRKTWHILPTHNQKGEP